MAAAGQAPAVHQDKAHTTAAAGAARERRSRMAGTSRHLRCRAPALQGRCVLVAGRASRAEWEGTAERGPGDTECEGTTLACAGFATGVCVKCLPRANAEKASGRRLRRGGGGACQAPCSASATRRKGACQTPERRLRSAPARLPPFARAAPRRAAPCRAARDSSLQHSYGATVCDVFPHQHAADMAQPAALFGHEGSHVGALCTHSVGAARQRRQRLRARACCSAHARAYGAARAARRGAARRLGLRAMWQTPFRRLAGALQGFGRARQAPPRVCAGAAARLRRRHLRRLRGRHFTQTPVAKPAHARGVVPSQQKR